MARQEIIICKCGYEAIRTRFKTTNGDLICPTCNQRVTVHGRPVRGQAKSEWRWVKMDKEPAGGSED